MTAPIVVLWQRDKRVVQYLVIAAVASALLALEVASTLMELGRGINAEALWAAMTHLASTRPWFFGGTWFCAGFALAAALARGMKREARKTGQQPHS